MAGTQDLTVDSHAYASYLPTALSQTASSSSGPWRKSHPGFQTHREASGEEEEGDDHLEHQSLYHVELQLEWIFGQIW
uniref:Uncharacterized protein n=1 Tax=Pristionchus pacificus TaxID=54126 RepID=A0A2A6CWA2_PRIPA|eukprot:PDM82408.1 hypothetical protein PRIPAC_36801 [Pristionchus pacificus]